MGKRILVADDSRTIQQAFAMVMHGSGYELSFAKSVDEALALAKKEARPDLVLSDVALGSGSGYDLCAGIKADPGLAEVPVFILASSQNPYDDVRGRKVGADGHMAKPFESQSLLDAVESALATPPSKSDGSMPQLASDYNDNTARISNRDFPFGDDDSYGEITIERGGAASAGAAPGAWAAKPAARPSGSRPAIAVPPAASPPPSISPRPSLIPGARPSAAMPVVPSGSTPQPSTSAPSGSAVRPPLNRTMMGFPSVKAPIPGRPAVPSVPAASAVPAMPAPTGPRPTPPIPSFIPPMRATTGVAAPLATPAAPVVAKPVIPPPTAPSPISVPAQRPGVPRMSPAAPSASSVLSPAPVTRKVATPVPPAAVAPSASTSSSSLVAAVSSAVEQKVAAIAARGPEYEAIAKLSREIIEQVVWEVVPELAETIIRQEIDRLASAKK